MKTFLAIFLFGSFFVTNSPISKSMVKKEAEQRCSCYAQVEAKTPVSDKPAMLPPGVQEGEYAYDQSAEDCLNSKRSTSQKQAIESLDQVDRASFETLVMKQITKKCPNEYKQAFGL